MSGFAEGQVDEIVRDHFFPNVDHGVFIDVGAGRPFYLSVSELFRAHGWRVIAIEPNPSFCAEHRAVGHEIWQYACSDHDEDAAAFLVVDSHGTDYHGGNVTYESFSSLGIKDGYRALGLPNSIKTISVDIRTLDTILAMQNVRHIDILSVDVEGWELEVLNGLSQRPTVMIIENLFSLPAYHEQMKQAGYYLWKRIHPNDVYVVAETFK